MTARRLSVEERARRAWERREQSLRKLATATELLHATIGATACELLADREAVTAEELARRIEQRAEKRPPDPDPERIRLEAAAALLRGRRDSE